MYLVIPKSENMVMLGTQAGATYLEYEIPQVEESSLLTVDERPSIEGAVFYVRTLAQAELLAAKIAKANHGLCINVYKHIGVFEALEPEVIQKEVSEKGILPKARF